METEAVRLPPLWQWLYDALGCVLWNNCSQIELFEVKVGAFLCLHAALKNDIIMEATRSKSDLKCHGGTKCWHWIISFTKANVKIIFRYFFSLEGFVNFLLLLILPFPSSFCIRLPLLLSLHLLKKKKNPIHRYLALWIIACTYSLLLFWQSSQHLSYFWSVSNGKAWGWPADFQAVLSYFILQKNNLWL